VDELRRRGFVAARSHVDPAGIKTTASMGEAVAAATQGLGIASRARREE
jgi:tRNA G26 N,N-dimethylase Trm1